MAVTTQRGTPVTGPTTVPQPLPIRNGGEPSHTAQLTTQSPSFLLGLMTKQKRTSIRRRGCGNGGKTRKPLATKGISESAMRKKQNLYLRRVPFPHFPVVGENKLQGKGGGSGYSFPSWAGLFRSLTRDSFASGCDQVLFDKMAEESQALFQ